MDSVNGIADRSDCGLTLVYDMIDICLRIRACIEYDYVWLR